MIVVKLMGGLGNQMFQYAAGKALALKNNVPLYIDTSFLETDPAGQYTKRKLELEGLNVDLVRADATDLSVFKNGSGNLLSRLFTPKKEKAVTLNDTHAVNPAFFQLQGHVYLNGFWQSDKYFKEIRPDLLNEFSPRYYLNAAENEWVQKFIETESVAIHVRRGDYVSIKSAGDFHGVCGMDYYNAAMQHMIKHLRCPKFYVFSDDLDWCRANFKQPDVNFVDLKSNETSLDLFLMSRCKHNIIANSSYSWWAAWLNRHEQKRVIAPKKWFSDPAFNPDIYCEGWTRL